MIPTNEVELIADFRAFVSTKDPEATYNWQSVRNCAFAQYLTARKVDFDWVLVNHWTYAGRTTGRIPAALSPLLGDEAGLRDEQLHTWGDLLARIDEIVPEAA
jgi:hypothetical protein